MGPPRRTAVRRSTCTIFALAAVSATACGGGGEEKPAQQAAPSSPATSQPAQPRVVTNDSLRSLGVGKDTSEKPDFDKPSGQPPRNLEVYDVVEGDGTEARAGSSLSMQYVGKSFSTGNEFDASWKRGEPFSFTLGAGEVIPGWDLGIQGMREGGRRILVIPPDLAYGQEGSPPAIGPNETLVFVVDLKRVQS